MIQIWIAMIDYLILAWIKHQTKFKGSLHTLTVMFREVILQPVQIIEILRKLPCGRDRRAFKERITWVGLKLCLD